MLTPKVIKVGPVKYKVKELDKLVIDNNIEVLGICLNSTIKLLKSQDNQTKRHTLIHEICHSFSNLYGMELNEAQIEKLSTILFQFILDNKETIKWIQS